MVIKTIAFGDSFVGFLNLFSVSRVYRYSGKTLKGISKSGNETIENIKDLIINKYNNFPTVENYIFCFGNVDVHLSYFYDTFMKNKGLKDPYNNWVKNITPVIMEYCKVLSEIKTDKRKYVIGVYPSVLEQAYTKRALEKYIDFKLSKEDMESFEKETRPSERNRCVNKYNSILKMACKKYKLTWNNWYVYY